MASTRALLVTLALDDVSTAHFEELRQKFYPPELNRVPAHVMLFHRLSYEDVDVISSDLHAAASGTLPFDVVVGKPYSIGTGVAYELESLDLARLHASLASMWSHDLIAQDRERYRPHVVVQNKVNPETARATLKSLIGGHEPFATRAIGLTLWTYSNGSWKEPKTFFFQAFVERISHAH